MIPQSSNALLDVKLFSSPFSARLVGEGSGEEVKLGGEENLLQADVNLILEMEVCPKGNVVEEA